MSPRAKINLSEDDEIRCLAHSEVKTIATCLFLLQAYKCQNFGSSSLFLDAIRAQGLRGCHGPFRGSPKPEPRKHRPPDLLLHPARAQRRSAHIHKGTGTSPTCRRRCEVLPFVLGARSGLRDGDCHVWGSWAARRRGSRA